MSTNDFYSLIKVPCVLFEGKHGDSYLGAYLGCEPYGFGGFCLHFCINDKRKSVDMSQDDFYELSGLTDETRPDILDCCEIINKIVKNDLAEYIIDWELIDLEK